MIGIDLIKTDRLERTLKRFGDRAIQRVLSKNDIHLYKNHRNFASLWATKEATAKALGCGIGAECGFHDIILSKSSKGAPLVDLSTRVKTAFGVRHLSVSITHDGDYTIAVVAIESNHS